MENITLTLDELNKMPKNAIALLYIQMSESFTILSAQSQKIQDQNERLIHQIEDLQEQIAILTQQRFGKRTETDKQVMGQLSFSLENMCVLNEAEALVENGIPDEPDIEKVKSCLRTCRTTPQGNERTGIHTSRIQHRNGHLWRWENLWSPAHR